jgi:hypothetical protein
MWQRLRNWSARLRNSQSCVVINRWGQRTPKPQVTVSVGSIRGSQSVYTFNSDDQGEASATMYGRSLAYILVIRLVDQR